MLFNSLHFLAFFPIVVTIYFLLAPKWRWVLLLLASYYFYMSWKAEYIVLIIISTLIDYFAANRMAKIPNRAGRKKYLYLSLLSNLGILFGFKYFNFFSDNVQSVIDQFSWTYSFPELSFLLPVGISFYTFQTLSYTIDVYYDRLKPEKHLGIFAVYVSFFPQLVAGPIERAGKLLPQFRETFHFNYDRIKLGCILMLWGFFKKIAIADRLAEFTNPVYNNPAGYDAISTLIATYAFAFQIFCDFSGYSDIAIGCALVLGYQLMENFRRPYYSLSIREFWTRWHISLSTWFRDYVYIPLGGNRVVQWKMYYNLMLTFLISGLWHGANWTFIIWGGLHGLYLIIERVGKGFFDGLINRSKGILGGSITYLLNVFIIFHLALFAWIFFRVNHIGDAWIILSNICSFDITNPVGELMTWLDKSKRPAFFGLNNLIIAFACFAVMQFIHICQERGWDFKQLAFKQSLIVRWSFYTIILFMIINFGKFLGKSDFIYFQF
ncbi:UNVERIFIED_CONTAM: hypothetical protein GTU68_064966 [Idotea baltica]|nr:hypothetical protein [Idotea baltica]